MRAHRHFPLILAVSLLSFVALACGPLSAATPTVDPNAVALAVQLTIQAQQASGESPSGPPPSTEVPPAAEVAVPTETPAVPTPTVAHVAFPASPGGTDSFMTDRSSAALAGERRAIADNLDTLQIERPFTANAMDYEGYLDITRGELSVGSPWIYVTIFLEGTPPAGSTAVYGVEVDIDIDGRGDYLIVGAAPASTEWTTNGVRILRDTNNDVGGTNPIKADPPSGGNGYDELVFDQGQGTDPDAAWIRLDPAGSTKVQVAFKYAAIGSPDDWTWGVWADEGVNKPEYFDYNDHFTATEAGSPTTGSSYYPVKAVAAVDNSCRWAVGFTPDGTEPGICYVPPTPTPVPSGSIAGRVTNLGGGFTGGTVMLGQGSCSASGYKTASLSSDGYYSFTALPAGTYCVTVDTSSLSPAHSYGWDPYNPDFPVNVDPYRGVTLGANEAKTGVNFSYVDVIG
jgi:hypothetical protein